jgi:hypothetical protein
LAYNTDKQIISGPVYQVLRVGHGFGLAAELLLGAAALWGTLFNLRPIANRPFRSDCTDSPAVAAVTI